MISPVLKLRDYRDSGAARSRRMFRFSIVTVARRYPQIAGRLDFQLMKRIGGERRVARIKSQRILCPQLPQDIGESPVDARPEIGSKHPAAGPQAQCGE